MKQSSKQNQEKLADVFFVKTTTCGNFLDHPVHKL